MQTASSAPATPSALAAPAAPQDKSVPRYYEVRELDLPGVDMLVELITGKSAITLPKVFPAGTHFQFRADAAGPLTAVGVTMPPWPGDDEAYEVPGEWPADASA